MITKNSLLLDTNIIVYSLRGSHQSASFIESLDVINISIVTAAELIRGCTNKTEMFAMNELLGEYRIIPIDESSCFSALEMIKDHWLKDSLKYDDALIAAT